MGLILSLIVGGLALCGASQLLNRSPVLLAHRKIRQWAADPIRMQHVSSCRSVSEWLRSQPDRVFEDDAELATAACIAALIHPVGHRGRNTEPLLRDLGQKLRQDWYFELGQEAAERRAGAAEQES